jgi:hypothetical protein
LTYNLNHKVSAVQGQVSASSPSASETSKERSLTLAQKLQDNKTNPNLLEPDHWPSLGDSIKSKTNVKSKGGIESGDIFPSTKNTCPKIAPSSPVKAGNTTLQLQQEFDESIFNGPIKDLLDDDTPMLDYPSMEFTRSRETDTDRLQCTSEVETRIFHQTMGQRKPQSSKKANKQTYSFAGRLELPDTPESGRNPKQPTTENCTPLDPLPAFVKELNKKFAKLLTGVRGFRGNVKLEVQFGRILLRGIKSMHIAGKENKVQSMSEEDFQRILHPVKEHTGGGRPTASFTNKLTMVPSEITGLTQLKECPEGGPLWDTRQFDWDVFYTFTFTENGTDVPFTIEINAETFVTRIKIQRSFGHLNVHGTKRVWDFRVSLTGLKLDEDYEEKYAGLAAMLKETLFIP